MTAIKSYLELFTPFIGIGTLFSCLGFLVGAIVAHKLDLGRARTLKLEADIKTDRLQLVPLIERLITKASHYPAPNIVRIECIRELNDWHSRFRMHLKGRRLAAFNTAWQSLQQTTEKEMVGCSGQGVFTQDQGDDFRRVSQILTSRLQSLLDCVKRA